MNKNVNPCCIWEVWNGGRKGFNSGCRERFNLEMTLSKVLGGDDEEDRRGSTRPHIPDCPVGPLQSESGCCRKCPLCGMNHGVPSLFPWGCPPPPTPRVSQAQVRSSARLPWFCQQEARNTCAGQLVGPACCFLHGRAVKDLCLHLTFRKTWPSTVKQCDPRRFLPQSSLWHFLPSRTFLPNYCKGVKTSWAYVDMVWGEVRAHVLLEPLLGETALVRWGSGLEVSSRDASLCREMTKVGRPGRLCFFLAVAISPASLGQRLGFWSWADLRACRRR